MFSILFCRLIIDNVPESYSAVNISQQKRYETPCPRRNDAVASTQSRNHCFILRAIASQHRSSLMIMSSPVGPKLVYCTRCAASLVGTTVVTNLSAVPTALSNNKPNDAKQSAFNCLPIQSSHQTRTTSLETLEDFGIEGASPQPYRSQQGGHKTTCFLKVCIIREPNRYTILFRIQSQSCRQCWPEKLWFDALRAKHAWTLALKFEPRTMRWYNRKETQVNEVNICDRIFMIPCKGQVPSKDKLVKMGQWICLQLNIIPGNTAITVIDEQSYFWLDENAVWADILGCNAALAYLKTLTGTPKPEDGFFEEYKDLIHSFFHPGTFSIELAAELCAPESEVDPSIRAYHANDDDKRDKDEDDYNDSSDDEDGDYDVDDGSYIDLKNYEWDDIACEHDADA